MDIPEMVGLPATHSIGSSPEPQTSPASMLRAAQPGFAPKWLVTLFAALVSPVAFGQLIPMYWINTPGATSFIEGSAHYERRNYRTAYSRFHHAALWADKRAQFNLGVMNVSGQVLDMPADTGLPCAGSGRPMACGWAWLELSAERDYPQFRRTADEVWSRLDDEQRSAGLKILDNVLRPRYGDELRIDRTASRMTSRRMRNGLSRVGYSHLGVGGPGPTWDLGEIISYEKRLYRALDRARVELGELKLIDEPGDSAEVSRPDEGDDADDG